MRKSEVNRRRLRRGASGNPDRGGRECAADPRRSTAGATRGLSWCRRPEMEEDERFDYSAGMSEACRSGGRGGAPARSSSSSLDRTSTGGASSSRRPVRRSPESRVEVGGESMPKMDGSGRTAGVVTSIVVVLLRRSDACMMRKQRRLSAKAKLSTAGGGQRGK